MDMSSPFPDEPPDIRALRSTHRYKRFRKCFMDAHPLCAECERRGKLKRSKELDHIVPLKEAPDRLMDEANVQALCLSCHHAKTANENRRMTLAQERRRARFERIRREVRGAGDNGETG